MGAKKVHEGMPVETTRHQGVPEAPGAPWWVVGPTRLCLTYPRLYKYSKISKTLEESMKHFTNCRKSQNYKNQSRGLFRHSAGGGKITEGFFIILVAPLMMRE